MSGANAAEWIEAVATVFAAFGTIGAVVVALWQVQRHDKRRLVVHCRLAVAVPNTEPIHLVTLRGTNDGLRPIKISMAYLMTDDGRQVIAYFSSLSTSLPVTLQDGESAEVSWSRELLTDLRIKEGADRYLYAFFMDVTGNAYADAFPGVTRKRRGPPWRRRDVWLPDDDAVPFDPGWRERVAAGF